MNSLEENKVFLQFNGARALVQVVVMCDLTRGVGGVGVVG